MTGQASRHRVVRQYWRDIIEAGNAVCAFYTAIVDADIYRIDITLTLGRPGTFERSFSAEGLTLAS